MLLISDFFRIAIVFSPRFKFDLLDAMTECTRRAKLEPPRDPPCKLLIELPLNARPGVMALASGGGDTG
jgi:hypothetical protein